MKKTIILTAILLIFSSAVVFSQNSWIGTWSNSKNYSVTISNATDKEFEFAFDCYNGKNIGEASGKAKINGNEAISIQDGETICKIKFVLHKDYIEVFDIQENDCYVDAGNGVYYAGKYKQNKPKKGKK